MKQTKYFSTNNNKIVSYTLEINEVKEENEITFNVGAEQILPFLDNFVVEKHNHEKYEIETNASVIFGKEDHGDHIDDKNILKLTVEILDVKDGEIIKTYDEQMKEILEKKEQGKGFIQKQQYQNAIEIYQQCAANLHELLDNKEYTKKHEEVKNQLALIHSNMALCYLKLENWEEVEMECDEVLKFDENNIKALYRKGIVLNKKEEYKLALNYLKKALSLSPKDGLIIKEYNLTCSKINEKQKKLF